MSERLLFVASLTRLLRGRKHVFVGGGSPAAATASLLQRALSGDRLQVTMLGDRRYMFLSNDYTEIFNCAATGRYDAFFMGGGQIDGQGDVNLIGLGEHPRLRVRWPGSRGTPLIYAMIPNTILFVEEHTRRVLVPKVDYISARGVGEEGVHHPGGPVALVTPRCVFSFDRGRARFTLESLNPGHTAEEVRENTGFAYDERETLTTSAGPNASMLRALEKRVLDEVSSIYPQYTEALRKDVAAVRETLAP